MRSSISYYAAVWSMLQNWRAFLFNAFDGSGYITVDKPLIGLWVQALSAKLLGFSGLALLLPQALAGASALGVLYLLVRRAFGAVAELVAALTLAVTPIRVVTDRNNTMDALLVLLLLVAGWAVALAAERASLCALLLGAALVGMGDKINMLQTYPALTGFAPACALLAPRIRRTRVAHRLLAASVQLTGSLFCPLSVDPTPATLCPYVGSSGSNSALGLVLGYNGLSRLTLAVSASLQVRISFTPIVVGSVLISVAALLRARLLPYHRFRALAAPTAAGIGIAVVVVAPLAWSIISVRNGAGGAWLQQAGPAVTRPGFGGRRTGGPAPGSTAGGGGAAGATGRSAPGNRPAARFGDMARRWTRRGGSMRPLPQSRQARGAT